MKKLSFYNIFVPADKGVICYNSFSGCYLILKPKLYDMLTNADKLPRLESENPETWDSLVKMGVLTDAYIDEIEIVKNYKYKRKFSSHKLHLILNPTMDCNFKCWYCYETHKEKSKMSQELADGILKHIKSEYADNSYNELLLDFFGGEPLLEKKIIQHLLYECKTFCDENEISLEVSFTTNGTCLTDQFIKFLKDYNVKFQITLDGNRTRHDQIRKFKKSGNGSYDIILGSIKKIVNTLQNYFVRVRVNFDHETLDGLNDIIEDYSFLKNSNGLIALHQVWQADSETIDGHKLLDFILKCHEQKILAAYQLLGGINLQSCYADVHRQAVINYDGLVYKCTARDYNKENSLGRIDSNGSIIWKTEELTKRFSNHFPQICMECKFFPSCQGYCSQKLNDAGENFKCGMNTLLSIGTNRCTECPTSFSSI